jgi:hypothetical protein
MNAKRRHRRRRTISWKREQARKAVMRDFQRKGIWGPDTEDSARFRNLVEARLR